jgi:hypothetical protein
MADITILDFDKEGALQGQFVVSAEITDVVLIAHGWNEGRAIAQDHYQGLVNPLEVILSNNKAQWQGHTVAYFGVIWPSSEYADDLTVINMPVDAGDPPGIVAGGPTAQPLNDVVLQERARYVARFLGGIDPELLATQALQAAGDNAGRDALLLTLQNATADRRQSLADAQTKAEYNAAFRETGSDLFSAISGELQQLFTNVADVVAAAENPLIGWLKQLRGDANTIIAQILNYFAYNEMKIRAGVVGVGLAHVLDPVLADGKRVHLVGHSFGGRLMTAATAAAEGGKISNLTLLEGAFSHNALSVDPDGADGPIDGAFKSVIDKSKVTGRIVAAHSNHDAVLWIAYPLASRALRDSVSLRLGAGPLGPIFGGPRDRYGAIGANGPQHLGGVNLLNFTGASLPELNPGVNALNCTSFVAGHSDVWKEESAYIVAAGLLSD